MISAKVIADSKNKFGDRITSFELVMPRFILAEFNTHRMFSRNSASSRAIPFKKMIQMVEENPFIPMKWMKDHNGMQGKEYFTEDEVVDLNLEYEWKLAAREACLSASNLSQVGLTKQICNRLLEPFMWHKVIVTATEYENFFALRESEFAEIHMQELARVMLLAYNDSEPKLLEAGEWHMPYCDNIDVEKLAYDLFISDGEKYITDIDEGKRMISVARCAGVSYSVIGEDGKEEYYAKLIARYHKLEKSGHWSPFEHVAKAMSIGEYERFNKRLGNFKGFIQLRKTFHNENQTDKRVRK